MKNNLKQVSRLLFILLAAGSLQSCASVAKVWNWGGKAPVFLHNNTSAQFFINGQEIEPKTSLYRQTQDRRETYNATYTTTKTTYLPALRLNPKAQYYTLTIKQGNETRNVLIKRDYNKFYLWLDMYLTAGIGIPVDVLTNRYYDYPEISVSKIFDANNTNLIIINE